MMFKNRFDDRIETTRYDEPTMTNTTLTFDGFKDKNYYMSPISPTSITYDGVTYTSVIQFMAMTKASYLSDYEKVERIMLGMLSVDEMTTYFLSKSEIQDSTVTRWRILSKYSMFNIMTHKFRNDSELRTALMDTNPNQLRCSDPSLYEQDDVNLLAPANHSMIQEQCDNLSEVMMAVREQLLYEFAQSYAHM